MSRSRPDSRRRTAFSNTSWQSIATGYGLVFAVLALLVAVSYPLASLLVAAVVGVGLLAAPKAVWLVQCARTCRALTVDLAWVRITVTGPGDAHSREGPSQC